MTDRIKRLPIIRHVRYFWLTYQGNRHYDMWRNMGALGGWREEEIKLLDKIWRGEA